MFVSTRERWSEGSTVRLSHDEECDWLEHLRYRTSGGFVTAADVHVSVMNVGGEMSNVVGNGSQGSVHRTGDFAVKVLRQSRSKTLLERFRREAHILARLAHSNVCHLEGVGSAFGRPCLVLEWVETDLARAMMEMPNLERLRVAGELASALAHLHSGDAIEDGLVVIHRDVKPANVGITGSGQVKLLDFGLATVVVAAPEQSKKEKSTTWQLTGGIGSPLYTAPENACHLDYGTPTDVYSFALTVWELFALEGMPFPDMSFDDLQKKVIRDGHRPKIPKIWHPRLAALLDKAWAPRPDRRPTAVELANKLRTFRRDPLSPSFSFLCHHPRR
ncbi:hypothetical protein CTAYLR_000035 [Chrysophaeum taylorii]|uniref:Protein kinase domain-containing protein n=1 Tax=Chrysophaeum taylorii TaxID=2483200 RepID=A0AAD7UGK9_9STRA|nr:hypothetical protein CTAYLR_000035 [Chrysophaeum taylorii]